jgi:hypothetical protein
VNRSASSVILVRPTGFGFDPETAASNAFQRRTDDPDVAQHAAWEFDGVLEALRQCGIGITVLDPVDPDAPNAVFPNNWLSTHADGTVVMYPMLTPSRRRERPPDAMALMELLRASGLSPRTVMDLSVWEQDGRILEGTGSLVLDRVHRRAYACLSPRTSQAGLDEWCRLMRYTPVPFTATMDGTLSGPPVYHTNVVMCIGTAFAVVCLDALPYPADREEVTEELHRSGREIIPIALAQMHRFAANMLELRAQRPAHAQQPPTLFLSETAFDTLYPEQRIALQRHAQLVPVPIPTIEAVGGGSVRCMLAENFLSKT